MKFKSETDILFDVVIFVPVVILLASLVEIIINLNSINSVFRIIVVLAPLAFLMWLRFGTFYIVKDSILRCRCGPLFASIQIESVHTLIKGQTSWVGTRMALARKGITLKYNKYDDIYISPKDKDAFIAELLKINSKIVVVEA